MDFTAGIEHNPTMNSSSSTTRQRKGDQQPQISTEISNSESTPEVDGERLLALKKSQQAILRQEIAKLVLWRQPINTILYCLLELIYLIDFNIKYLISCRKTLFHSSIFLLFILFIYKTEGSHQKSIKEIENFSLWTLYWFGLGLASSVGFGTGLHTFLFYLGPFIAQVTIAAYECGSIKFPRPPYPHEIICPSSRITNVTIVTDLLETGPLSFWKILWKVKLEAFFWGLGSAFGEFPPYFMARAARLSTDDANEELSEFEQLLKNAESRNLTLFDRMRYSVYRLIQRIGFFGILLCASVPNPLFDLAGLTCGYFLISFWRFFFATIIGKALIKISIQTIFIIFLFSEHHVDKIIRWIKHIPYVGNSFQTPFKEWLYEQKSKMHRKPGQHLTNQISKISLLTRLFNLIVAVTIGCFIISIVNSLAQRYYKRTRMNCKTM